MSQATVPTSFSGSSATPGFSASSVAQLHPQVKLALSYLDSSLEDELMRYRKARSGKRVAPSSVRVMQGSQKLASKADVELTRFVPIDQMPKPSPRAPNSPSAPTSEPDGSKIGVLATEFLDQIAVIPEDGDDSRSFTDDHSALDISYSLNDLLDNPSIDHLSRESLSRSIDTRDAQGAEDYLESSEELLRSLAQEEADAESERSGLENLMTPFGIGSMLLLLMASGMFGYLVMNPATFASIGSTMSRLFKSSPPIATSTDPANPSANPSLTTSGVIPTGSEFMDLSLNNLAVMGTQNNPSGLPSLPGLLPIGKPNGRPTSVLGGTAITGKPGASVKTASRSASPSAIGGAAPAATPGSLFQGGNSSLGNGGIFKDPAPQAEETPPVYTPPVYTPPTYTPPRRSSAPRSPEPAYRAPTQSTPQQPMRTVPMELPPEPSTPTSIPPVPAESAAPTTPTYRVEAPYTGDRALEKAQQADPGAYFRNGENGAVVQMGGSYSSREEAEAKAQSLKKQGFDGVEVVK